MPELDRLFGVPQPAKYHPEIDTGVHALMVLELAAQLSDSTLTRFAALTHDLGKGLTSEEILPSHHGHEERSAHLVEGLCHRLKAPNEYRELAWLTAKYHGHIHMADQLRPQTYLKVLEQCDAFRRPDRFQQMLIACEADIRGRKGFEGRPYPQAERFQLALKAASGANAREWVKQGLKGEAIKQAVHDQRLQLIKAAFAG
jgi:tRNA nucleotidyltransferase (CCA-adding enzyme)